MNIIRLINESFNSNCYLIDNDTPFCIVVDPGSKSCFDLFETLKKQEKIIQAVILTHEHYDHISGVNTLASTFDFELICSNACNIRIRDSKANLSTYIDCIDSFVVKKKAFEIDDGISINIAGHKCTFFYTPGHSPGGICIKIDDSYFTGDTLLNQIRTPLNLPGSSYAEYQQSIKKLKQLLYLDDIIYPGHGEPFEYKLNSIREDV